MSFGGHMVTVALQQSLRLLTGNRIEIRGFGSYELIHRRFKWLQIRK